MKRYPIIVIGAGAGGLVIANGAAKAGKQVLIVERAHWGGDCTNFGCIPSKSLIARSHIAHSLNHAKRFGFSFDRKNLRSEEAFEHVKKTVDHFIDKENQPALETTGVTAIQAHASFLDPHTLLLKASDGTEQTVWGEQIVIATGSSPVIPPIPGLAQTPYLTNETIFSLKQVPKRIAIMGAGPIGSELSQALQRLGSQVTLFDLKANLQREDADVRQTILDVFKQEGITVYLGYSATAVAYEGEVFHISLEEASSKKLVQIQADALLVSSGRASNLPELQLENAGVVYSKAAIAVDCYGRTNLHHIWAIGDAAGPPFFTHKAENQARSVLTSLLLPFGLKKRLSSQPIPRVTFTDPEIASVGLSEEEAFKLYRPAQLAIYQVSFSDLDRAVTTDRTEGFVKVITKKWSSKILGATIVAPRAGEMLMQICLAMHANIPLRKLAEIIHPYPVYSLAIRKAADLWLTQTILPSLKKFMRRSK